MLRSLIALTFCLLTLLPVAYGREAHVAHVQPTAPQGQLMLDVDIDFTLGNELHDAAQKGVPLYFTVDLNILQPRWWWFDKSVISTQQTWRIQYNALTRQWHVTVGQRSLPATSLDEALDLVRHIRHWPVGTPHSLQPGTQYIGQIRLRLDTSRLARPFQVDALNSNTWSLNTPWKNFAFSLTEDMPRG
ncbi:MAG: DUF4390 domain-containing protein [Castellaniella sp.]